MKKFLYETEIVTLQKILTIGVNTYVCFILPQVGEKIKLIINQNESLKLMRLTSFGYPEEWDRSIRNLIPFFPSI